VILADSPTAARIPLRGETNKIAIIGPMAHGYMNVSTEKPDPVSLLTLLSQYGDCGSPGARSILGLLYEPGHSLHQYGAKKATGLVEQY
jgi:hypothetical protein